MTEEAATYKIKNKFVCEVCGKSIDKVICSDCLELEKGLKKLKVTNIEKYKKYLDEKLKELSLFDNYLFIR